MGRGTDPAFTDSLDAETKIKNEDANCQDGRGVDLGTAHEGTKGGSSKLLCAACGLRQSVRHVRS